MEAKELISPPRLRGATFALAKDAPFADRLAWWLRGAHAAERWFQFEWAYRLQDEVTPDWSVVCEVQTVDVVVRPVRDDSAPPAAGVEIKWYGNWWVDDLSMVRSDIDKIGNNQDVPCAAALFFLDVEPKPDVEWLAWLPTQRKRRGTMESPSTLVSRCIDQPADDRFDCPLAAHPAFDAGVLWCFVWYNKAYLQV